MVFLFFCKKFLWKVFDIYWVFCIEKNLFNAHSSSLSFFLLKNLFGWEFLSFGVFLFFEIALHGDSTTVEITHKNNVFLICFILNGVSFLREKISWEGIRHLLSFLYRKKLVPCAFVIYAIFSFEISFWMGVFFIWHISFDEISLHGDLTTMEITSKNNVFLIC